MSRPANENNEESRDDEYYPDEAQRFERERDGKGAGFVTLFIAAIAGCVFLPRVYAVITSIAITLVGLGIGYLLVRRAKKALAE